MAFTLRDTIRLDVVTRMTASFLAEAASAMPINLQLLDISLSLSRTITVWHARDIESTSILLLAPHSSNCSRQMEAKEQKGCPLGHTGVLD